MLYFDVTKVSGQQHRSGIVRVSQRLRHELARLADGGVTEVAWSRTLGGFVGAFRLLPVRPEAGDWLITPELFSEQERPGFGAWLAARACRAAAVYHDSIPLQYPEFTWPHSVARHPHYLKMLAQFDLVIANSRASARELLGYWEWLGIRMPEILAVPLGADANARQRREVPDPEHTRRRGAVMVGILEPRKNQSAVLDAAERLWREGVPFPLTFVGRVNPHFGRPLAARVADLRRAGHPVKHIAELSDEGVAALLAQARCTVLPSLAEGCGLPVLESLWAGVPAICSDIAALREAAEGGGCRVVCVGEAMALVAALRELLTDDAAITRLAAEACACQLPTWTDTGRALLAALK